MKDDADKTIRVEIADVNVPVWQFGESKNPPILFIHGYPYGFSHFVGDLPTKYLRKDYCIYAFDLPGFGESAKLHITTEDFINQIIKKLGISRKFSLYGVSYGGLVALKYAYYNPDKVGGVIIGGTPFYRLYTRLLLRILGMPARFFKRNLGELSKNFMFLKTANLKNLNIPVLLLYSKKDTVGTVAAAKRLDKILPNSKLVITEGRTHGWLMHRIDESGFLDEINKFLTTANSRTD